MRPIAATLLAAFLTACASTRAPAPETPTAAPKTAWIVGRDGRAVGQASFTEGAHGVLIRLEFGSRALPAGWHGVHLHTRGDCSDFADGFQAAGGHLGMAPRVQHGLLNPAGPETGDLPNLFAPPAGSFAAEFFSRGVTLNATPQRGQLSLLDADGAALVIHEGPDDQRTQPIGAAGARIACVALTPLP